TGMSTLLHAPIQASVQQTEWQDADNAIPRTNRHDTTLVFSDGNEMDMTASHTAVITRNLKNNQADKPEKMEKTDKIDLTSFLAGLNSSSGKADESREFRFFPDPTSHSCPSFEQEEEAAMVKKINFNEFLMSLKSNEKALNPIEGPEKENVFFVPSQASEDVARSSVEFVYSHEPPDTCNYTKIFREQEDGMEMTRCQASGGKAVFPGVRTTSAIPGSISSETVFRGDKTVGFSTCDDMEMTGNYTDVICNASAREMSSCQNSDGQEKARTVELANKTLPTRVGSERDFSIGKTEADFKNPPSVDVLRSRGAGEPLPAKVSEAHQSSQLPLFSEKSVVFPSGENMDLTGNCTGMIQSVLSGRKAGPGYLVQEENTIIEITVQNRGSIPTISAVPADRTIVFTHSQDDMEVTASHTVAVNNNINGFENQE
ncbi:KNL1 protein, partial [Aegotheles bennettii]|nr:KNL1 protein [Aegotheles bennettii]